jgi:hypothetical protein
MMKINECQAFGKEQLSQIMHLQFLYRFHLQESEVKFSLSSILNCRREIFFLGGDVDQLDRIQQLNPEVALTITRE